MNLIMKFDTKYVTILMIAVSLNSCTESQCDCSYRPFHETQNLVLLLHAWVPEIPENKWNQIKDTQQLLETINSSDMFSKESIKQFVNDEGRIVDGWGRELEVFSTEDEFVIASWGCGRTEGKRFDIEKIWYGVRFERGSDGSLKSEYWRDGEIIDTRHFIRSR